MNPTLAVGLVAAVIIGCLGAGLYVVGERLIAKAEEVGDLKVKVAERDAIIAQKEKDSDLSGRLVRLEGRINDNISVAATPAREMVINVTTDKLCKNDPALAAAAVGVIGVRRAAAAGGDSGQTPGGRGPAAAVRPFQGNSPGKPRQSPGRSALARGRGAARPVRQPARSARRLRARARRFG